MKEQLPKIADLSPDGKAFLALMQANHVMHIDYWPRGSREVVEAKLVDIIRVKDDITFIRSPGVEILASDIMSPRHGGILLASYLSLNDPRTLTNLASILPIKCLTQFFSHANSEVREAAIKRKDFLTSRWYRRFWIWYCFKHRGDFFIEEKYNGHNLRDAILLAILVSGVAVTSTACVSLYASTSNLIYFIPVIIMFSTVIIHSLRLSFINKRYQEMSARRAKRNLI